MKCILLYLTLSVSLVKAQAQLSTQTIIDTSAIIHDHFKIYISFQPQPDTTIKYKAVYYLDANLKSGKKLRELLTHSAVNHQFDNFLFIGIGHTGNYHQQRRRDFIPSFDTAETGSGAMSFYGYLKEELLPEIESRYLIYKDSNSVIGHSFGGLFVLYSLLQNDDLFTNYYALSPSLWVDNYSIYKHSKVSSGFTKKKHLYFVAGSKENFNRILRGTEQMQQFLNEHHYSNLTFEYDVIAGKTHNSEVPVALQRILGEKLK